MYLSQFFAGEEKSTPTLESDSPEKQQIISSQKYKLKYKVQLQVKIQLKVKLQLQVQIQTTITNARHQFK